MSVRSKALRFAILVSIVISVSGCAMYGSSSVESDAGVPDQESMDEAVYGDSGEQPPAQQDSGHGAPANMSRPCTKSCHA